MCVSLISLFLKLLHRDPKDKQCCHTAARRNCRLDVISPQYAGGESGTDKRTGLMREILG